MTSTTTTRGHGRLSTVIAVVLVALALVVSIGAELVAETLHNVDAVAETIADTDTEGS